LFSEINISQGSVAARLRYGEIFSYRITANLLQCLTVKQFWKSVKFDNVTAMSLVAYFFGTLRINK